MIETFTAEVVVTQPDQDYEPELARLASAWFGSEVRCVARGVVMSAETGRFLARGTYVRSAAPPRSHVEKVAHWLGLQTDPGAPSRRLF